jgi:transposase
MEVCGCAHPWAHKLEAHGCTVKLTAPQFIKPYVKNNKNDANNAEVHNGRIKKCGLKILGQRALQ